jgi:hypothetical protein
LDPGSITLAFTAASVCYIPAIISDQTIQRASNFNLAVLASSKASSKVAASSKSSKSIKLRLTTQLSHNLEVLQIASTELITNKAVNHSAAAPKREATDHSVAPKEVTDQSVTTAFNLAPKKTGVDHPKETAVDHLIAPKKTAVDHLTAQKTAATDHLVAAAFDQLTTQQKKAAVTAAIVDAWCKASLDDGIPLIEANGTLGKHPICPHDCTNLLWSAEAVLNSCTKLLRQDLKLVIPRP